MQQELDVPVAVGQITGKECILAEGKISSGWARSWSQPRRMTAKGQVKQETNASWTSHCKPFTKKQAKGTGKATRVQAGILRGTQVAEVARMQLVEHRVHGRKATARTKTKEQRKVGRAAEGHAGQVASQDTLQLRVPLAAARTCMALMSVVSVGRE